MKEGSLSQKIWNLSMPLIVTNLLSSVFTLVDLYFVGKISVEALSAVGIGSLLDMIFVSFGMGGSVAAMAIVSRYTGAMNKKKTEQAAWNSIIFSVFLSVPITLGGIISIGPLLHIMGAEEEVFELSARYLKIILGGYIFQSLYFYSSAIFRGVGDVKRPAMALAIGVILNIALDPLLIFGWGPLPKMGVAGAALATLLTRGIGAMILIVILVRGIHQIKLRAAPINKRTFRELIRIGLPSSGERMLIEVAHIIFMILVVGYGTVPTAAYTIVTRLRQFILMPGFGFGVASAILVGQSLGAEQPEGGEKASWLCVKYYEIFMVVTGIIFFVFAPQLIKLFNQDVELIEIGVTYLRISTLSFPALALSLILYRALCGAGYTIVPFTMRLAFTVVVRIAMGILLGLWFGLVGLWYAIVISQLLEGISSAVWFKLGRWKYRRIS